MPRKKTTKEEQATLVADTEATLEAVTPKDGIEGQHDVPRSPTAKEFVETLFSAKSEADISDEDKITQNKVQDNALSEYGTKNFDETQDFTTSGNFSGPLDIERKLDEEIAALDAELSEGSGTKLEDTKATPPTPDNTKVSLNKKDGTKTVTSLSPRDPEKKRASQSVVASAPYSPASFYQGDFRHLDRDLTDLERQEWNDIYASFRSQSILTGVVAGVDQNELPVKNENGKVEMKKINSLVVIGYRVKVLIPEPAVLINGEKQAPFLTRGMLGATVDYVIISIDRENGVALASRTLAMVKRRRAFSGSRSIVKRGDIVDSSVLVVGPKRCLLTCGGYDVPMRPLDMSYTPILDMRDVYRPGQILKARVIAHEPAQQKLQLSVKEATSNPFDGAERRHPVGSRRQAVISGKYKGGVFCTMADGVVCLCLYSNSHYDSEFMLGDNVIIYISQYNFREKHIYGRIVSKW